MDEGGGIDGRDFTDREVSLVDLSPFCDQLEKFIKYLSGVRDLNYLTYDYPIVLKNRLDADVVELETILSEVKEALTNAERLKSQRKSIKTEKMVVKKILKRMREDEIREMESAICSYDKPMYSRWENVKSTQKPEVLEAMLSEIKVSDFRILNGSILCSRPRWCKVYKVKGKAFVDIISYQGKQHALESLTVLVTRKLNHIQVFQPLNTGEVNNEKSPLRIREKTVIPLPFPSFCTPIIPIPPPPPPPPPPQTPVSHHLQKRSYSQRLSVQRRRRLERRENEIFERRSSSPNGGELPLVPLTLCNDLPNNNLARNIFPAILNPARNSSHDVLSDGSADNTGSAASTAFGNLPNDVTLLNINEENNNENNEAGSPGREFQSEMRTVLQALFGDLRSAPTLLLTESTSSDVGEAENPSNTNGEIELYTLKKSQ